MSMSEAAVQVAPSWETKGKRRERKRKEAVGLWTRRSWEEKKENRYNENLRRERPKFLRWPGYEERWRERRSRSAIVERVASAKSEMRRADGRPKTHSTSRRDDDSSSVPLENGLSSVASSTDGDPVESKK